MGLKTIFALMLAFAPGTTLSAAALDNFYGVAMASCVPTGQTSAELVLFNSAAEASFRDGGTGEIILTCPIPQTLSRINLITVRYKDDGVLNAGSQVVTALRQKRYVLTELPRESIPLPRRLSRQIAMPSSLQSFPRKGTGITKRMCSRPMGR